MTALKEYRRDLTDHLAAGLGTAATPWGSQVNPPTVIVIPGQPYVAAQDYCTDAVTFSAWLIPKQGDPAAMVDALDDLIDQVRSTLRDPSPAGHRYRFVDVSGPALHAYGEREFTAVIATVGLERPSP